MDNGAFCEIQKTYTKYRNLLAEMIFQARAKVSDTVVTKGRILNHTPYYWERIGRSTNGKKQTISIPGQDFYRYNYDSDGKLIMVEEYSCAHQKFCIQEIFVYGVNTERLLLASGELCTLSSFDNPFSMTSRNLTYSERGGFKIEEYKYVNGILEKILISHGKKPSELKTEEHIFIYDDDGLAQIRRVCANGYEEVLYSDRKPNFRIIEAKVYEHVEKLIRQNDGFVSMGIEGFVDQHEPMICISFTEKENPPFLIAEWGSTFSNIYLNDYQFTEQQEKECIKTIAKVLIRLSSEGLLSNKQIYFHQNQQEVIELYSTIKGLFDKNALFIK